MKYVPTKLVEWENGSKTVVNIAENLTLFKLSILSGLLMALSFLLLAFVLYKLFSEVNRTFSLLLLLFVAISVTLSFSYMPHRLDILTLLSKPEYLEQMGKTGLETEIILHLEAFNNGIKVNSFFWGLWLLPLGYLVFQSGFLPRILGIFLMIGCLGYIVNFRFPLFFENYQDTLATSIIDIPAEIGEFGICLWLLIMADRKPSIFKKQKTS